MITIAFNIDQFYFRGTEIAIYDYAHYNEVILGNRSIITTNITEKEKNKRNDNQNVLDKFISRFPIFVYKNTVTLNEICKNQNADYIYTIKYGDKTGFNPLGLTTRLLVHCVYVMHEPHGHKYIAVSPSIGKDYVPHIVHLPEKSIFKQNLRFDLNIPDNSFVIGRHGGLDTFYLPDIDKIVSYILNNYENVYFLFMPRPDILKGVNHKRLITIDPIIDLQDKRKFIETCDILLHAQILGETQGLSILEFAFCNKPVVTWNGGRCQQHLKNLGDKAILYNNYNELINIIDEFIKNNQERKKENLKDIIIPFTPENVMKKFNEHFLIN